MKTTTALVPLDDQHLQKAAPPEPSVLSMVQMLVEKGVTAENVAALKELRELDRDMRADAARAKGTRAFVALQRAMPKIFATKPVPNADGTTRYKFAPFEELMAVVGPLAGEHGFGISFNSRQEGNRVVAICELIHEDGFSRTSEFAAATSAPPKSSGAQADGATVTLAKRYALCHCLNIVIDRDDDARAVGEAITAEQAADLRRRVHATGSDEAAFLKFAQAASYEEIQTGMFATLDANLRRKEKTT